MPDEKNNPGPFVFFGSGETSPTAQKVFDYVLRLYPDQPTVAMLETPAGFELNSDRVIGRVADFLTHNLQNYHPNVQIIPARARGSDFSPEDPEIVQPMLQAQVIFMGPGSPSYAVRQLKDSLAWNYILARHRLGAALVFASAAVVAVSLYALPVYEIYKVGEDLHWKPGLDLLGGYNMPLVFIPHWNNNDGGTELDTSRCFMGQSRFARLMEMLPAGLTVIGIDEKTALIMDPASGIGRVIGSGHVTLIHTGHEHDMYLGVDELHGTGLAEVAEQHASHVHVYKNKQTFPLSDCCPIQVPVEGEGLPQFVWQQAVQAAEAPDDGSGNNDSPPDEVQALIDQRAAARAGKDWAASDALRDRIAAAGWKVVDTKEGQRLEKMGS